MATDYAIAVEQVLGVADYGTATTYADLVRTWRDGRAVPTQAALDTAYTTWKTNQDAKTSSQATQQAAAVANAKAAVNGTLVGALTPNQLRLMLLIIYAERGWIDATGKIAIP